MLALKFVWLDYIDRIQHKPDNRGVNRRKYNIDTRIMRLMERALDHVLGSNNYFWCIILLMWRKWEYNVSLSSLLDTNTSLGRSIPLLLGIGAIFKLRAFSCRWSFGESSKSHTFLCVDIDPMCMNGWDLLISLWWFWEVKFW